MLFERRSNAVLFFVCVEKPNTFVLDFSQFDFSVSFWKNGFFVLRIIGDAIFIGVFPQIGKCSPAGKVAVKGDESQDLNRRHMDMPFYYFVMVPAGS